MHGLKHRHRGQAPSHSWTVAVDWPKVVLNQAHKSPSTATPPCHCSNTSKTVGGSLLPIALYQSPDAWAETPPSGTSPLPQLYRHSCLAKNSPKPSSQKPINCDAPMSLFKHIKNCGRERAPDSAGSVTRCMG